MITEWLALLGLSEYAQRFVENDIDVSVLRHLTDQDLKELGVSLGHRRKMQAAIVQFADAAPVTPQAAAQPEPKPRDDAERRQLTVMFTDLVGSTALSTRLDPEELRVIIGAYHKAVAETVARFDGFVAKYMGDGVLAYFGYPRAHEDDAERAVRAGLTLVEAVGCLSAGEPIEVRVGIATGLVVVGDLIGAGEAQERGVVGETPNLAARLQTVAVPGAVVIAAATHRLLAGLFEYRDLGSIEAKGFQAPVEAFQVLRPSRIESRFDAMHSTVMPLVGRQEELELLLRRWQTAKSGEGRIALIAGEPGIGKSRLTAALMERLAGEPHTRLRYFCSPQHTDSALHPFIGQMERAAGLAYDDMLRAKLDKLDALLARSSTPPRDAALLAEMLSLRSDGRYPALDLDAQQRRQKTLQALTAQLEALTSRNPVLMIFEDAHWADPTSLELLGRAVDRIARLPVLLIVTFRPEFEPPWIGRPHVTAVIINRLGDRDVGAMIDRVAGGNELAAGIRADIIERTDGIPLFVEEMTKAVLEAGSEREASQTVAAAPSAIRAVPASLHASLMARLDRLGEAKDVAQVGAAIGREFSHALLAAAAGKPEAELTAALDRLVAAGLLFRQGAPPDATYLFKHALIQDAAYGTLLREPRRALHLRIAQAIGTRFTDLAETQPELLARHCTEAGLIEQAAHLWGQAGQLSLERSALAEAAVQLTRALDQIAALPATAALRSEQIKLQGALITPLMHIKGYAAPETRRAAEQARVLIEQAEALGEPPEDPLLPFSVLYSFFVASYVAFDGPKLRQLAAEFLSRAEAQAASIPLSVGHRITGISLLSTGDIAQSRPHFDRALALYDPAEHRRVGTRFGVDTKVAVLSFRAMALWLCGYPDAAIADAEQAVTHAREIGDAAALMYALDLASVIRIWCGAYQAAGLQLNELASLAEEAGAAYWRTCAMVWQGGLLALTGRAASAVEMLTTVLPAYRSTGSTNFLPLYVSYLAKAYAAHGEFADAWRCIDEAIAAADNNTGESWCVAEIRRTAAEIALLQPEPDAAKAEACFERALAIARAQEARSWELRAAMSMVQLWRDQGKWQQAYDLLAPVYGWFTEGFDTLDLKEAKSLLDELMA
jgi:class 3 adenylate cyclase/predicted ATPase